jgi:hypothetical protein
MPTFRLFLITVFSVLALALFLIAGDKLLTFLNVDLIATILRTNPLARSLEVNEAAAIAQARNFGAAGALALGLAIVLAYFHLLQRGDPLRDSQLRLAKILHEQELVLVSHYRDLGAQLARSRDTLASDMGDMGASTQHMRGALELRFASVEALLKRMDDTLISRLEGLAAQVSHTLQSSDSIWMSDQAEAARLINERLQSIEKQFEQRFEGFESQLRSDTEMALDTQSQSLQLSFEHLSRRVEHLEAWLRSSGEKVSSQLTHLSQRVTQAQSGNNSSFTDFNAQPAQFNGTHGTPAELQSVMLNLAHLQVDLRAERSALRKRLRDLPTAPRA